MATEITTTQAPDVETAQRMAISLQDLLSQPERIRPETIGALSTPATREWIAGRIGTLLANYYVSQLPQEMQAAIADDWISELSDFPAWALQKACRWWMGRDNPDHRRKPLPGDISERAHREMGVVKLAKIRMRQIPSPPMDNSGPATPAQAAEIMALAGFGPKKMAGAA